MKKEVGITLTSLVVTIIILLILAGVTLNTVLRENGLLQKARLAVEKYKEAEEQEQSSMQNIVEQIESFSIDYNDFVGAYVEGYEPKTKESLFTIETNTSGYTQKQDFTTEEIEWRIWDYDKYAKVIRLVSSKPTNAKLNLNGATGYNNGVWAINEVCRQCYGQYDENGEMKTGITVANIRRTDIQNVSSYDYTKYKHKGNELEESDAGTIQYGDVKQYGLNKYYPEMWINFDSKWEYEKNDINNKKDVEGKIWEEENNYTNNTGSGVGNSINGFKESFCSHDYLDKEEEFINPKYYELLFKNDQDYMDTYWLSRRFTILSDGGPHYGLTSVNASKNCNVSGEILYNSGRNEANYGFALRPIITIDLKTSGYSLKKVVKNGTVSFELN